MTDRRTVDKLSIEELERVLLVKKRAARQERLRQMADQGRLTRGHSLLLEEKHPQPGKEPKSAPETTRPLRRGLTVEPLDDRSASDRRQPLRPNWRRVREAALLTLEVAALVGLIVVLVGSFLEMRELNREYAQARGETPSSTPTPLIDVSVLPGAHAPPVDSDSPQPIPEHLRNWVASDSTTPIAIPTPESQPPTRIVIPKIGVDAPVLEGDSWETLKKGAGHHLGTANPGERGNVYISAHNDIYGQIFRRLEELDLGDEVIIYAGATSYRYVVREKRIVEPTDVSVMYPTTEPILSLQTCYPYMVDTHRLVVIARLSE